MVSALVLLILIFIPYTEAYEEIDTLEEEKFIDHVKSVNHCINHSDQLVDLECPRIIVISMINENYTEIQLILYVSNIDCPDMGACKMVAKGHSLEAHLTIINSSIVQSDTKAPSPIGVGPSSTTAGPGQSTIDQNKTTESPETGSTNSSTTEPATMTAVSSIIAAHEPVATETTGGGMLSGGAIAAIVIVILILAGVTALIAFNIYKKKKATATFATSSTQPQSMSVLTASDRISFDNPNYNESNAQNIQA